MPADYDKLGNKIFSQRNVYEIKRVKIVDTDISETMLDEMWMVPYFIERAELRVRRRHDDGETPENILFLHLRAEFRKETRRERIIFPLAGKKVYEKFMSTYEVSSIEELILERVSVYYALGEEKNVKGIGR